MTRRLLCALAALAGFASVAARSQVADNFDDGDDAGWTRYDPIGTAVGSAQNSWTFPAGGYRVQARPTPNPALGPARVGSLRAQSSSDFQASVDLLDWNESYTQGMGIIARTQTPGLGTTRGYIFGYVSGPTTYAQIVRVSNEGTAGISGSAPVPILLERAKDYRLVFEGRGASFEGRIYELPMGGPPLVTIPASDSSFADGPAGLIAFSLNRTTAEGVDVTFDNYSWFDTVPPTLEFRDLGFGLIHVLWPGYASAFELESSDALPATTWTPVDELFIDYFADTDRYVYQHDASAGQRFFRLHRP